ncbi:uncharacterized protein LOC135847965 [Planococcus citri]|uniref:uncharacterized protein LOC135847965 n=1 Tax=Planococcus citri TaxID=170843 RepID=UPI0031F7B800
MAKTFLFAVFLIVCLIVQASCGAVPPKKETKAPPAVQQPEDIDENDGSDESETPEEQEDANTDTNGKQDLKNNEEEEAEDESEEEESDEEEEVQENDRPLPFLTCLLFENDSACDGTCSLVGSVYGQPVSSGTCGEQNDCNCNISRDATLEDYWNKKFDSGDVLAEILKNKKLSKKVFNVLRTPFRTPQETKSDLKEVLNEKQLQRIIPKDKTAQKIFLADGKFDHGALRRYITKNLKSLEVSTEETNFPRALSKALRSADSFTFYRIHDEIRRSGNKFLNKILTEFMNVRNLSRTAPSAEDGDEENLIDLLDAAVINKLVKLPPRDPSTRRDRVLNLSSSRARGGPGSWFKLRGFRKSEVSKFQQGNRCWNEDGYYRVCLSKSGSALGLTWRNNKDVVGVDISMADKNEINQKWYFQNDVVVSLSRKKNGQNVQTWKFGDTVYQVSKNSKGAINGEKWSPEKDEASLEKYKQQINSWCDENGYMVGKENCVIY